DLLAQIESLDDRSARINAERAARQEQLQLLARLSPSVKLEDSLRAPPRLDSENWAAALQFVEGQSEKLQAEQRASNDALFALRRGAGRLDGAAQAALVEDRRARAVRAHARAAGRAGPAGAARAALAAQGRRRDRRVAAPAAGRGRARAAEAGGVPGRGDRGQ